MLRLSVIILTKKQQNNIEKCLQSIFNWADEIIVIDNESADKIVELADKYANKVIVKKIDTQGRDRKWAYSQVRNEWILTLDANEMVSLDLKEEISHVLQSNPKESGFTIPVRTHIGDYRVRYSGWYPNRQMKLFRQNKLRYATEEIYPCALTGGWCGHLKSDILRYAYKDLSDFLSMVNRQSSQEAQQWHGQGRPMRLGRFIWRSVDRFFRTYIGRNGFRDGFIGFAISFYASSYQLFCYLKYRELSQEREGI